MSGGPAAIPVSRPSPRRRWPVGNILAVIAIVLLLSSAAQAMGIAAGRRDPGYVALLGGSVADASGAVTVELSVANQSSTTLDANLTIETTGAEGPMSLLAQSVSAAASAVTEYQVQLPGACGLRLDARLTWAGQQREIHLVAPCVTT